MKRFILLIIAVLLALCGCCKSIEVQTREQLDLSQKYVTEMNYEQAVFRKLMMKHLFIRFDEGWRVRYIQA